MSWQCDGCDQANLECRRAGKCVALPADRWHPAEWISHRGSDRPFWYCVKGTRADLIGSTRGIETCGVGHKSTAVAERHSAKLNRADARKAATP